jgi:hypothetical protein
VTPVIALLAVAVLAVAWLRYCEVSREIEVAVRNTPAPFNVADDGWDDCRCDTVDEGWCDCPVCAPEVARLRALFNDTPKENS